MHRRDITPEFRCEFEKAQEYSRNGDNERAYEIICSLLSSFKDAYWLHGVLAGFATAAGSREQAMWHCRELVHLLPTSTGASLQWIMMLCSDGRLEDVRDELSRFLGVSSSNLHGKLKQVLEQEEQKQLSNEEILDTLSELIARDWPKRQSDI